MQIGYFTERPYRWLPEELILKNRAFFAISNKHFDREKAADDYNYYLDEYCYAEDLEVKQTFLEHNPQIARILIIILHQWSQPGSNRRPLACKAVDDQPPATENHHFIGLSVFLQPPATVGFGTVSDTVGGG